MDGTKLRKSFGNFRLAWNLTFVAASVVCAAIPALAGESPQILQLRAAALARPTDFDAAMAYANASITARDEEAAIATLERLLFYNPNMPGVRFALGNLYARLGAHAMAARYYEEALAAPSGSLAEPTRKRAETYLARSLKQLQPTRMEGEISAGMRYDTNPAHLPAASFTNDYTSSSGAYEDLVKYRKGAEESAYVALQLHAEHDLSDARRHQLELNFAAYASENLRQAELSGQAAAFDLGPRLSLIPGAGHDITIRPYIKADSAYADEGRVLSTGGGGAAVSIPLGRWLTLEPFGEWRTVYATVNNSDPYTSSSLLSDGNLASVGMAVTWQPADILSFEASGRVDRLQANEKFLDAEILTLTLAATFDVPAPLESMPYNWSFTPFVRYVDAGFGAANDSFEEYTAARTRHDKRLRTGLAANLPITAHLGLAGLLEYQRSNSNIERFRNHGMTASVSMTFSF